MDYWGFHFIIQNYEAWHLYYKDNISSNSQASEMAELVALDSMLCIFQIMQFYLLSVCI